MSKYHSRQPLRVELDDITGKLEWTSFAGRSARVTDRRRDLLRAIAALDDCDEEFTVQQIVEQSRPMPTRGFQSQPRQPDVDETG